MMPERLRLVMGRRRGEISVMTRDDDHRRKRPLPASALVCANPAINPSLVSIVTGARIRLVATSIEELSEWLRHAPNPDYVRLTRH
jgi:hypothetical protein